MHKCQICTAFISFSYKFHLNFKKMCQMVFHNETQDSTNLMLPFIIVVVNTESGIIVEELVCSTCV